MAGIERDISRLHGQGRDASNLVNAVLKDTSSPYAGDWGAGFGGYSAAAGGYRTSMGIAELCEGQYAQGSRDTSGGLGWCASGAGNIYKAFGETGTGNALGQVGGGFSALSGGIQMYQGADRLMNGRGTLEDNTRGAQDLMRGGVATTAGVATALGSTTASPYAAAFALGCGIGDFGDSESARRGCFGIDERTGKNRSITDWAADTGVGAGQWARNATGSNLVGDIATYGTTALACVPGAALALGNTIVGGAERLGGWIGSWFK